MEYFEGSSTKEESPLIDKSTSTNKPEDTRKDKDDRSELKFDKELETEEEAKKRLLIEETLDNYERSKACKSRCSKDKHKKLDSNLKTWQNLAISTFGLVADNLRCKIWPLLLEVDPSPDGNIPSLKELSTHDEYQQVVLDVNRSLKRFPPGIPYKQRVALQDQLTILILRVIMKYPYLRYYQGYHDVAITVLLVVGEVIAFRIMEKLSTNHLRECMAPTMEKTSYRLNYMYALLYKVDNGLHNFMDKASVGTMFALPWYLTWFGHSLNKYKDVVRLYDFFLATPPLMPIYVATSLVIQRREEIFLQPCDMASIHCLLSQIPDNIDFEEILTRASSFYKKYPPEKLEYLVKKRIKREHDLQKREERMMRNRLNNDRSLWRRLNNCLPTWMVYNVKNKYGLFFAAATVLLGYVYFKATENTFSLGSLFKT